MKPAILRFAAVLAAVLLGSFLFFALGVPRDFAALKQKQKQIRELQRQNTDLAREIQKKRERIEKLRGNRTEQELEIRERQKLLRPGETTFILQDQEKK